MVATGHKACLSGALRDMWVLFVLFDFLLNVDKTKNYH